MKTDLDNNERSPGEFIAFGLTCAGLFIAVAGVVLSSPHIAIGGLVLAGLGLIPFALEKE
jgi:hypothetical protein